MNTFEIYFLENPSRYSIYHSKKNIGLYTFRSTSSKKISKYLYEEIYNNIDNKRFN